MDLSRGRTSGETNMPLSWLAQLHRASSVGWRQNVWKEKAKTDWGLSFAVSHPHTILCQIKLWAVTELLTLVCCFKSMLWNITHSPDKVYLLWNILFMYIICRKAQQSKVYKLMNFSQNELTSITGTWIKTQNFTRCSGTCSLGLQIILSPNIILICSIIS